MSTKGDNSYLVNLRTRKNSTIFCSSCFTWIVRSNF